MVRRSQWEQHVLDCLEIPGGLSAVLAGISEVLADAGVISHDSYARPRPHPYDAAADLKLTDGGDPDTFGDCVRLIQKGTYDFGDTPNYVQVAGLVIENLPDSDTYVFEFYRSPDGVTLTPIGAIRARTTGPFNRSFTVKYPCRPFNNDIDGLYGRLKTGLGGDSIVPLSLSVGRWVPPSVVIPMSTGVWPTG